MLRLKTTFLTICMLSGGLSISSYGQVQTTNLQPAAVYDAGRMTIEQGGLGPDLWRGTTVERAAHLLSEGHISTFSNKTALSLFRAVLLSPGTPPHAEDRVGYELYTQARLNTILALGELDAFTHINAHADMNADQPIYRETFANFALLNGQIDKACQLTSDVKSERKSPYWAKLRAYCHFTNGELAAAELTADLLRRKSHEDDMFFSLLGNLTGSQIKMPNMKNIATPLHIAMTKDILKRDIKKKTTLKIETLSTAFARAIVLDTHLGPHLRLAAFYKSAHTLDNENIEHILNAFATTTDDLVGGNTPNISTSKNVDDKIWTPQHWGQAYHQFKTSEDIEMRAKLAVTLLKQADSAEIFPVIASLLSQDMRTVPATIQSAQNPAIFARLAVHNRDINALRGLYQELSDELPIRARIALAADALGGGFALSTLGLDIETRLKTGGDSKTDMQQKSRAVRDAYIAFGLGAHLSQDNITALLGVEAFEEPPTPAGARIAIQDAARRRTQAETALWAAHIINDHPLPALRPDILSAVLSALNDAGLHHISGQLAAQDFLGER